MTREELLALQYGLATPLGPALKAERERRGLAQVAAAIQIGINYTTVRKIEQGVHEPRHVSVLVAIVNWLLREEA